MDVNKKIEELLSKKGGNNEEYLPTIFDLQNSNDAEGFYNLQKNGTIQHIVDDYKEQLKEYFQICNPGLVYSKEFANTWAKFLSETAKEMPLWQSGRWVYFPWISTVTHVLEEDKFFLVRTARNRELVTTEEQKKFYDAVIGIAGLSVGNSVALAIVLQGGAKHIKLADFDRLALTNTNRIRAGVENLGIEKVKIAARQIYQLNPYAEVEIFPEGLTDKNLDLFFDGAKPLDLVIDEVDNLAIKHLIREYAKKHKLPVIMGADNGDNAMIDIERYDQNPDLPFFHGRIGDVTYEQLKAMDKFTIGKTIARHIGEENITERTKVSLAEMGKTIVSWPQLGGAALLNGCALAFCARRIICGDPLESSRALVSLDEKLVPSKIV